MSHLFVFDLLRFSALPVSYNFAADVFVLFPFAIAACVFESKWKAFSRRVPRKNQNNNLSEQSRDASLPLLQHRQAALNRVKGSLDCTHLEINWHLDPL